MKHMDVKIKVLEREGSQTKDNNFTYLVFGSSIVRIDLKMERKLIYG